MSDDRIRIADFGHPGGIIEWLRDRGYEGEGAGTDGFGKPHRTGVVFARDLDDPAEVAQTAWVGQALVWDGENVMVEAAGAP